MSLFALRRDPVEVVPGMVVYVFENPRIVEAAADRGIQAAMIAGNGNPATAVTTLIAQLQATGGVVRYHGDFDAAGIAICARLHAAGIAPWRMAADDYQKALDRSVMAGIPLDRDPHACGPTPWDNGLGAVFNADRRVVHEELLVDDLLAATQTPE